jgi:methionyl-tRNA synthetase
LRLSALAGQIHAWVKQQEHWRPNTYNFTVRYLEEGLHDRAITRDLEWGVPIPVAGYEDKRIYIWFENIIGYLSASKEWAGGQGQPDRWRDFWEREDTRSYYFIGKDNLFFHTLQWPAELIGIGGLNLPYDVPASEFLNLEGRSFSTSRNWAVWVPEYLSRFEPDPLRYYLSAIMPETADTDFSWEDFVRRNNDELVATFGNLAHRLLTFTYRNFDRSVPEYGEFGGDEEALMAQCGRTIEQVGRSLSLCRFREALRTAMDLAHESNRYLDMKAPWRTLRTDRDATAVTVGAGLSAVNALKVVFAPFLPFSADKLHSLLGFSERLGPGDWRFERAPAGQRLPEPQPLFAKLEDSIVEEERQRLGLLASR